MPQKNLVHMLRKNSERILMNRELGQLAYILELDCTETKLERPLQAGRW